MSVNILVDVLLEERENQFIVEDPILNQGTIAINFYNGTNGSIKIGNGLDKWSILPYITDISDDIVNKWRTFAQNSGTNSRLITLPDMHIAYASYDADTSDISQIVASLGTFLDFSSDDEKIIINSSNIDIDKITPSIVQGESKEISFLKLEKSSTDFVDLEIKDAEARGGISNLQSAVDEIKEKIEELNNSDNNTGEETIVNIPIFGSKEDGAELNRVGIVSSTSQENADSENSYIFLNSKGEWVNFEPQTSFNSEVGIKQPISSELIKNLEDVEHMVSYISEVELLEENWQSCDNEIQTIELKNIVIDGNKIQFILSTEEELQKNYLTFYLNENWKDNIKNPNDLEAEFVIKADGINMTCYYSDKVETLLKYWPDYGAVVILLEKQPEIINADCAVIIGRPEPDLGSGEITCTIDINKDYPQKQNYCYFFLTEDNINDLKTVFNDLKDKTKSYTASFYIGFSNASIKIYDEYSVIEELWSKPMIAKIRLIGYTPTEAQYAKIDLSGPVFIKYLDPKTFHIGCPYYQTINFTFAYTENENKKIILSCYPNFNFDFTPEGKQDYLQNQEAYSCLTEGIPDNENGTITFYCLNNKPKINIPILIKQEAARR